MVTVRLTEIIGPRCALMVSLPGHVREAKFTLNVSGGESSHNQNVWNEIYSTSAATRLSFGSTITTLPSRTMNECALSCGTFAATSTGMG